MVYSIKVSFNLNGRFMRALPWTRFALQSVKKISPPSVQEYYREVIVCVQTSFIYFLKMSMFIISMISLHVILFEKETSKLSIHYISWYTKQEINLVHSVS